jgi:hypothetical protein
MDTTDSKFSTVPCSLFVVPVVLIDKTICLIYRERPYFQYRHGLPPGMLPPPFRRPLALPPVIPVPFSLPVLFPVDCPFFLFFRLAAPANLVRTVDVMMLPSASRTQYFSPEFCPGARHTQRIAPGGSEIKVIVFSSVAGRIGRMGND